MYPTLVIRSGESIDVRVESTTSRCAFAGTLACRRVLVEASPGEPIELEIVPGDTSKPMALTPDEWDEESLVRLMVAPGGSGQVSEPAAPDRIGDLQTSREAIQLRLEEEVGMIERFGEAQKAHRCVRTHDNQFTRCEPRA